MKNNPYEQLVGMIREEGKHFNVPSPGIGIIYSLNPIQVNYGDTVLNKKNLKINKQLTLQVGEEVFLYPSADEQTYFLICVVI